MIATLLFLHQAALSQVVPFHEPVGMLRTLVRKLSEQSHVKLEVTPAVWDSGIYIASKDLTLKEIMDSVATITYGEWDFDQGAYFLRASKTKEQQAQREEQAAFRKEVVAWMESQAPGWRRAELTAEEARTRGQKYSEITKGSTFNQKEYEKLQSGDPGISFIGRILLAVGPDILSSCPKDDRIVFSSRPTAAQRQLPDLNLKAEYDRLTREMKLGDDNQMPSFGLRRRSYGANGDAQMPDGPIQLAIQRDKRSASMTMTLTAYLANGSVAMSLEARMNNNQMMRAQEQKVDSPKGEFTVSPAARQFVTTLSRMFGEKAERGHGKEIEPYLDLSANDPIAVGAQDFYSAWAESMGGNFVGCVPDMASFSAFGIAQSKTATQKLPLSMAIQQLRGLSGLQGEPPLVGRTRLFMPSSPEMSRELNADRRELQDFFNKLKTDKAHQDEVFEAYALSRSVDQSYSDLGTILAMSYLEHSPEVMYGASAIGRIYAVLEPAQRKALMEGSTVGWPDLRPRAKKIVLDVLYKQPGALKDAQAGSPYGPQGDDQEFESNYYDQQLNSIREEPTFSFPNGPETGIISAKSQSKMLIGRMVSPDSPRQYQQPQSIENMVRNEYWQTHGGFGGSYRPPETPYYLPQDITKLKVTMKLGKDLVISGYVPLKTTPRLEKAVLRRDLPKDIQDAIAAAEKKVAEEYKNVQFGPQAPDKAKP